MDCKQIEKNIIFYIDKEMSSEKNIDFISHLNHCEKCNVLVENITKTIDSTDIKSNIPDDYYFYTRLKQKMDSKSIPTPFFSKRILQPIALFSLLIIGGYMGIFIGNQYKSISMTTEDNRTTQIKSYAEENYLIEMSNENFESLLTSNQ
jgi:hypothetical protein